ncbi:MAG TPA: hypothetical protein PK990_02865 [Salinivirgaceae bacterium]|nr:hypothetical protein [Salinivirgaceae bacterium]
MKKINFITLLSAFALIFSGCEKTEPTDMKLDMSKKATLKVYCYAQLNHTQQGLEAVPNGTQVMVRIDNAYFNPAATGYWTAHGSIQNGMVEFEIPVTNAGVTAQISGMEFTYDQVQAYGSVSSTIKKIFRHTGVVTEGGIKPNETRTVEITFSDMGAFDNLIEKVSKKFALKAELDITNTTLEYVPQGTSVTFFNDGWMEQKTVGSLGYIEINVPKGETIYIRFEASKTVYDSGGNPVNRNYRYQTGVGPFSESSPITEEINCGNGMLWQ